MHRGYESPGGPARAINTSSGRAVKFVIVDDGRIRRPLCFSVHLKSAVAVPGAIELLVLDASFIENGEEFTRLSGSDCQPGQASKPLLEGAATNSG